MYAKESPFIAILQDNLSDLRTRVYINVPIDVPPRVHVDFACLLRVIYA